MAGKQDNTRHSKLVFEVARASADSEQKVNVNRRIFKIIVIGDSNVGKTCLTYRFCIGKFPNKTESTIGVDFREKTIQVDKETIKVRRHFFFFVLCPLCFYVFFLFQFLRQSCLKF